MSDLDEMKNKAAQGTEHLQEPQHAQNPTRVQDPAGAQNPARAQDPAEDPARRQRPAGMIDDLKKNMDADEDGDFDMDDAKQMGGDVAGKVKGLFKKD